MKILRLSCFALFLLFSLVVRSEAGGWHGGGGGWHGGGGYYHGGGYWHGGYCGPGVVFVGPGYYYPPYPYYGYYGGSYYDGGYPTGTVYQANTSSIAVPVQEELSRKGYYHGAIDGVVGSGTRSAIASYQRHHGLEITGMIDAPLLRSLGI